MLIGIAWVLTFSTSGQPVFGDTAAFALGQHGWFALTNYSSNAYFPWRFDRLLAFAASGSFNFYVLLYLWILLSGIIAFGLSLGAPALRALCASAVLLCALYLVFGIDIVVISTLAWVPWVLLLPHLLERSTWIGILLTIFISLRFIASANQLAFFGCLILLLVVRVTAMRATIKQYLLLLLPVVSIIKQFRTPILSMPLYPPAASVVPHWGSDLGVQPLIGAGITTPSIDRLLVGEFYWPLAAAMLAVALTVFVLIRGRESILLRGLVSVTAILNLCVLLDCASVLPISLVQIMPLAALGRLIPNLIFIPLTPIALGFSMLLLTLAAATSRTRLPIYAIAAALIVLITTTGASPYAVDKRASATFRAYNQLPPEQKASALRILNSPSLAVIKKFGLQWIVRLNDFQTARFRSVSLRAEISATHEPGLIKLMRDRKPKTRWTTSLGNQIGKEWVMLRLPQTRAVRGIALPAEPFSTDFPRGLEISSATQCSGLVSELDQFVSIVREPQWNGWINFSADGYPYIEPPSRVNVIFPMPVQAQCLLIRQIGEDKNFDWSISELRIADQEEIHTDEEPEDGLN